MSWRIFYAIIFKEIETRGVRETGRPFFTARRAHLLTTAQKWGGGGIAYGNRALSEGAASAEAVFFLRKKQKRRE